MLLIALRLGLEYLVYGKSIKIGKINKIYKDFYIYTLNLHNREIM